MEKCKKRGLQLFIMLLVFSGCISNVNDKELPEAPTQLLVSCFICPQDTIITAIVNHSNAFYKKNTGNQNVANADVTIFNGIQTASFTYNSLTQKYTLSTTLFPLTPGTTYYLSAKTAEGETVTASCTIPTFNADTSGIYLYAQIDTTIKTAFQKREIHCGGNWKDIPNQSNYYEIFIYQKAVDYYSNDTSSTLLFSHLMDNQDRYAGYIHLPNYLVSTEYCYDTLSSCFSPIIQHDFYLLTADSAYYHYAKSVKNYLPNAPFGEKSVVYSNITGGLGIFGAFQKTHIIVH